MLLYCREYEDDDDEDMSEEECLKKSSDDTYSLQYTVQLTIIFDKETCGTYSCSSIFNNNSSLCHLYLLVRSFEVWGDERSILLWIRETDEQEKFY